MKKTDALRCFSNLIRHFIETNRFELEFILGDYKKDYFENAPALTNIIEFNINPFLKKYGLPQIAKTEKVIKPLGKSVFKFGTNDEEDTKRFFNSFINIYEESLKAEEEEKKILEETGEAAKSDLPFSRTKTTKAINHFVVRCLKYVSLTDLEKINGLKKGEYDEVNLIISLCETYSEESMKKDHRGFFITEIPVAEANPKTTGFEGEGIKLHYDYKKREVEKIRTINALEKQKLLKEEAEILQTVLFDFPCREALDKFYRDLSSLPVKSKEGFKAVRMNAGNAALVKITAEIAFIKNIDFYFAMNKSGVTVVLEEGERSDLLCANGYSIPAPPSPAVQQQRHNITVSVQQQQRPPYQQPPQKRYDQQQNLENRVNKYRR